MMKKLLMICLMLGTLFTAYGQTLAIKGNVTDQNDVPLPGASILEKGTSKGSITNFDGDFEITVKGANSTLIVSYLGYKTLEIPVDGRTSIQIKLEEDSAKLDEVILVGYGQKRSTDLTGSVKVIGSEDFNKGITNSPGQLLQGKISGVNVTTGSGEPGSAIDINIRGVNTVRGSSNPLFVVDGVPLDGGSSGSESIEGFGATRSRSPLNFLNPQDIENITVLKDASATAIYGTRASNGVVIIQTKKGVQGKTNVTLGASFGVATVAREIDVLNANEYRQQTARLAPIVGRDPNSYIDPANANTNWQDEIYQTALTQNYNFGFSGGSENTKYNVSLGYLDQEGLVKTTGHEKVNGRINIGTSTLDDRLKLQMNLTVADLTDESQATGGTASSDGNLITSALRANPTAAPRDADGNIVTRTGATDNPVSYFDLYRDRAESKRILGNISATLTILEGFDYKLNLAYENSDTDRYIRVFSNAANGGSIDTEVVTLVSREDSNKLIENYFTYTKEYEKFNFDVLLGHSYQIFNNKDVRIRRDDFSTTEIDPIYNIGLAQGNAVIGSSNSERKLQSFFGRINTSFLNKYLITASLRADGSSVFGKNNRYGYFPSAALGWKISEEDFLKNSELISNLKLRLGWGQTGNQAVPVRVTQPSYNISFDNSFTFNGTTVINGLGITRTPNPDLKWEVTEQFNAGLDWAFLKGRINGTIDYFSKTTTDLFLEVSAAAPSSVNTVFVNSDAEIINKGFEFGIDANIIRTNDFSLDFGGNISFLTNTIEGLNTDIYVGAISGPGASGETSSIFTNGQSAGSFYMYRFGGFDADGNEILSENREIVGDALPKNIYGFNINANYKDFDLALNFNGVAGVDIFNNTARAYSSAASLAQNGNNIYKAYLNTNENPLVAPVTSSRFIENGSFLRLNNVTLGWNIRNESFLNDFRLYLTGQNLFAITDYTGYDPEVNTSGGNTYGVDFSAYPRPRTIILGLDLSF